jgi:hypothetical protein
VALGETRQLFFVARFASASLSAELLGFSPGEERASLPDWSAFFVRKETQ